MCCHFHFYRSSSGLVISKIFQHFFFFFQIEAVVKEVSQGRVFVGVKKLLGLLDTVRVMKNVPPNQRVAAFVSLLEDEGVLTRRL